MSSSVEDAMAAYGLLRLPYNARVLNPLADTQDLGLLSRVDGWKGVDDVAAFLTERAAARRHALVVIGGGSGTGRTSLANFLIHAWAQGREASPNVTFDPGKLIVARGRMTDFDAEDQLLKWVLNLLPQAQNLGFVPSEPTEKAFDTLLDRPAVIAPSLQRTLSKLAGDLYAKEWALAGVFEDVKRQEVLTLANDSFKFVDSLLVLTVENTAGNFDAVLSNVEEALDSESSKVMLLSELDGAEARDVVIDRWRSGSADPQVEMPFDEACLQAAFAGRRRPVARVLKLMELLLSQKLTYRQRERWPEDKHLAFTETEIARKIAALDEQLFPGR